jgi:hypothetical protein
VHYLLLLLRSSCGHAQRNSLTLLKQLLLLLLLQ